MYSLNNSIVQEVLQGVQLKYFYSTGRAARCTALIFLYYRAGFKVYSLNISMVQRGLQGVQSKYLYRTGGAARCTA